MADLQRRVEKMENRWYVIGWTLTSAAVSLIAGAIVLVVKG